MPKYRFCDASKRNRGGVMTSGQHHAVRRDPDALATEAIEDYAKAIYALQRRQDGPIGTSALAERLGLSPASVTAMLKRMHEMKLVAYDPYHGVTLTPAGERVALEVMRHHRLLESYLAEALGMSWDRVHDEAEVLEHYISEEDRKSTRLNSSHVKNSYAVFCLKKKNITEITVADAHKNEMNMNPIPGHVGEYGRRRDHREHRWVLGKSLSDFFF